MVIISICLLLSCAFLSVQCLDIQSAMNWLKGEKEALETIKNSSTKYSDCMEKGGQLSGCILDTLIYDFPFAVPNYTYCGPGTDLTVLGNRSGINEMDDACKEHDWAYSDESNIPAADKVLTKKAWTITRNESLDSEQREIACLVTIAISLKSLLEIAKSVEIKDLLEKVEYCVPRIIGNEFEKNLTKFVQFFINVMLLIKKGF